MAQRVEAAEPDGLQACARHPERATGVRCQRCLDPICVDCMTPAAVGFQCASCVANGIQARHPAFAFEGTIPFVTYALVAVNVVVALFALATSDWAQGEIGPVAVRGGLLGGGFEFDGGQLELIGVDAGEWYRIFTGAFIHAGPIHLGFNMFVLWQIGTLLEPTMGRVRFALLYTAAVLGGAFGALALEPDTIAVGASGGVFGLMGALFVAGRGGFLGAYRSRVGFFIIINLALTFAVPGISIGGHIGGLLAGAAIGWLFHEAQQRRMAPTMPIAAALVLDAALFAGCLWAATLWTDPLL